MTCPRCIKRGRPDHFASEPKCAFETEVFSYDNWQCATMNALRAQADLGFSEMSPDPTGHSVYDGDQNAAVIPIRDSGDFIVLGWYKERGATEQAYVMHAADDARRESNRLITPLTLEEAHRALGGER